ncbi:hypothetical protein BH23BAC1_BH23BAC1_33550 [soil metagenome]
MGIKASVLKLLTSFLKTKKLKITLFILCVVYGQEVQAQSPKVPTVIDFAGMKLRLTEQVKRDIQSDVDALYRNEKYWKIKVDRVNLYMPIIERILKEEKVPDDFKYLVIQESSLISDAVSTSNAVGYWQFKQDAGEEVGLKINSHIDERLNIVASTRGATVYLKKHNSYFNNWLYSLLAYNMGRGGARSVVDPKHFGAKKMDIDKSTHWYILKFLAHKVAFENALGKNLEPELMLVEYTDGINKSLKDISRELEVEIEQLEFYNKWLKRGTIPSDKTYTVIIPVPASKPVPQLAVVEKIIDEPVSLSDNYFSTPNKYPLIEGDLTSLENPLLVMINGRPGIVSREGDNVATLASHGGIKVEKFFKINDLKATHKVKAGQYYYFKNKKNNAPVHKHTVQPGETMWDISQMYGMKEASILRKNRMASATALKPGLVLWLRYIRPSNEPVAYSPVVAYQQNDVKDKSQQSFNIQPETKAPAQNKQPEKTAGLKKAQNEVVVRNELKESSQNSNAKDSKVIDIEAETEQIIVKINLIDSSKIKTEEKIVKAIPVDPGMESPNESSSEVIKQDNKENDKFENESITFIQIDNSQNQELNQNDQHVVKQGETLYGIARNYSIPLKDLAIWNNLKFDEGIQIGQVLSLKSPGFIAKEVTPDVRNITENVQEQYINHRVATGETLYKIAREYNVTIKEVMEWNKKTDFNVALGEVIKIKKLIVND